MDTERKSSDKPANPIRTQLKTGSSWPHLPQSGHMVDTFLCCVVHLFFCGEPANTKPTKYKEAEKGWQKKTLGLDSTENVCVVAESFHNQQSYGSWWEERGPLMAAAAAELQACKATKWNRTYFYCQFLQTCCWFEETNKHGVSRSEPWNGPGRMLCVNFHKDSFWESLKMKTRVCLFKVIVLFHIYCGVRRQLNTELLINIHTCSKIQTSGYLIEEWARSSSAPIALRTYDGSRDADVQALHTHAQAHTL